jgi:hypothetical protein
MGIVDDYKSAKNRDILYAAASKMIKDKYNMTLNEGVLSKIINNIIGVIANDVALINTSLKLIELNNMTLIKIKEYIGKQIETNEKHDIVSTANAADTEKANLQPILEENKIPDDDELMQKLQELEEKRQFISTLGNVPNETYMNTDDTQIISTTPVIALQSHKIGKRATIKKMFVINSHSRDWIKQPQRNMLHFKIGIDLKTNVIVPVKILLPVFVKDLTPYINLSITDDIKTHKYVFFFQKNNGEWDEWTHIQDNNSLYLSNNNWKISLYNCFNSPLALGSDDINVLEVAMSDNGKDFVLKISHEDHIHLLKKNDTVYVKTYSNDIEAAKVLQNDDKFIIRNEMLRQEDFINSKILNWKAQYYIVFSYYTKD